MKYTERDELAILEMQKDVDSVSINEVKKVLMDYHSNMIYCELFGKLLGIISTGDILRAYRSGLEQVQINKNFTYLHSGENMKARTIFREKSNINALPVVTRGHCLIGDYSRWDDLLVLDYELDIAEQNFYKWEDVHSVGFVQPSIYFSKSQKIYERFYQVLKKQNIEVKTFECAELFLYIDKVDMILFVDENENRACSTILEIVYGTNCDGKDRTYKNILGYDYFKMDQYKKYLQNLCDNNIKIIRLEFEESEYYKGLQEKINKKCEVLGKIYHLWPESVFKDFFSELFSKDYANQIFELPVKQEYISGRWRLKDCKSKFYNVDDGERLTMYQPKEFTRSIFFYGRCYIVGRYVEDKYTIESHLQNHLSDNGEKIRVVNCGSFARWEDEFLCIVTKELKKGDIIILAQPDIVLEEMIYLGLDQVMEKNDVDVEWMLDEPRHVNHKINKLYSDAIYEKIIPLLSQQVEGQGEIVKKDDNFIRFLYLDRYFKNFDVNCYERIGAIVMNCNPFTYGHRYLIEQALHMVDFLIVFVVEEDRSIFSFAERFKMVSEGVADLKNIMVVPSGPYILSRMSFPEYFSKETSEDIVEHTEQDIATFAEQIASQLRIKYRFVGEEPEDMITNQYNVAMKKVLPKYDIELNEIPRKEMGGRYISASLARKCLTENDLPGLLKLVPHTTIKVLFGGGYEREDFVPDIQKIKKKYNIAR